mmetsp:Transcript_4809/g.7307  ORF Transcript_4809/g.7307 Transcript_4809/m.7307 type:complete len:86 (+) Transcript_4809:797-1054(+)
MYILPRRGCTLTKFNVFVLKNNDYFRVKLSICLFFFFIDPDFQHDPALTHVNNITLSYTFFQTDMDDDDEEEDEEREDEVEEKSQ